MSRTRNEGPRGPHRPHRTAVAAAFVSGALLLTGCSEESAGQWARLGLPEPASQEAPFMGDLWVNVWIAAGIIGVGVLGLIIWSTVRYRRRRHDTHVPVQMRYNLPMEVLYTVAPIVVVAVLFVFVANTENRVLNRPAPQYSVTVTAQQWSWTFTHDRSESVGGRSVWESGNAADLPELWLVKDKPVEFKLHSPDVIHSFWVPSFYFKLDVVPGRENSFTVTPDRYGTYAGRCAELCGYQHSRMLFTVRVVSQQQYDRHMRQLAAAGQTGRPIGGVDTTQVAGLESNEEEVSGQ